MSPAPRIQLAYAAALAVVGVLVLLALTQPARPDVGAAVVFALFTALTVFTLSWGFPAPYVGYMSLERVVQVSTVLIFGGVEAAWINAAAQLIWPFLSRRHDGITLQRTVIRALHNAGMVVLMILAGSGVYHGMGGELPLLHLDWSVAADVAAMVVAMQVVNEALMAVITHLDGKDFRKAFSPVRALVEIGNAPLAVLTALIYNQMPPRVFALFVFVLAVVVVVVKGFADTRQALEGRLDELLAINRVGQAVSSSLILDDLVDLIYEECRKLLKFSAFFLVLYDEANQEIDFRLHHNEKGRQPRRRRRLGEGILGWIVANNKAVLIEDWATTDSEVKRHAIIVGETPASFIGVPVTYRGNALGAISVQSFVPNTFTASDLNLMVTFAGQVAVAIANARLFTELEASKDLLEQRVQERTHALEEQKQELRDVSESLREAGLVKEHLLQELQAKTEELDRQTKEDSLTGLFNRRYMDARLTTETRRAERFGHAVTLAMADIDHFKAINDRFSHFVGDEVLRGVAVILRKQCRTIDVISRYGGEEFVLCFPETPVESATVVCEKIRQAMMNFDWVRLHPELSVTISIGLAGGPPEYNHEKLLAEADNKLYEAKRTGRNRVCF